jgi:hypothetical protein
MDWTVEFPGADGYAIVRTVGIFDVADHVRMITDIVTRPGWRPGMDVLFDHRALDFGGRTCGRCTRPGTTIAATTSASATAAPPSSCAR